MAKSNSSLNRPFLFTSLVFLFFTQAPAQASESGLQRKLTQARAYSQSKPDSALLLLTECLSESRRSGNWAILAETFLRTGIFYAQQNVFDKALPQADSAEKYGQRYLSKDQLAAIYNLQANILMQTGQYQRATERYLKCISLAEKQKNHRLLLMAYSNLSMLYSSLIQYEKSFQYARKQFGLANRLQINDEIGYSCSALIDLFSQTHKPDSMEKYVKIMATACHNTQDPNLLSILATETGVMYNGKKQYKLAIPQFLKSIELNRQMGDTAGMMRAYLNLGLTYTQDGQSQKAVLVLKPAVEKLKAMGNQMMLREGTKELAEAYAKSGDYAKAYRTQLDYQWLSDIALNNQSRENIQKLEARYQSEKKEAAIRLLQKDNALKATEAINRQDERNLVLLSSLALLGFGLFFGNRYLARRKLATQKEILENRLRLSADLHDDVGATLSSISIYAEAIKNKLKANQTERVPELVEKIGENARETVATLSDLVWNLNPANDSAEKLFQRMESTAAFLLSAQNTHLEFEVDPTLLDFDFSLESKQNIYLIFKETINNAAKYARATLVKASIKNEGNMFEMKISDNGTGFNESTITKGNGLRNTRSRAEALNGSATISTSPEGTSVVVCFPMKKLGKRQTNI